MLAPFYITHVLFNQGLCMDTKLQSQEEDLDLLEDEVLLDPDADYIEGTKKKTIPTEDIILVFLGGVLGGILRYGVFSYFSQTTAMIVVNITGSFILGYLLESLVLKGEETKNIKAMRLLLGTGCMGAFTTYSTFISQLVRTMESGFQYMPALLAVLTVIVGIFSAIAGITLAYFVYTVRSKHA